MKEGLGKRAVAVLAAVVLLAAGAALGTGSAGAKVSNKLLTYAGSTSVRPPVRAPGQRNAVITRMAIAWDASCVDERHPAVRRDHRARDRAAARERRTRQRLPVLRRPPDEARRLLRRPALGTTTVADVRRRGRPDDLGPREEEPRESGRWRVTVDVIDNDTSLADDSCKTSTFNWSAARAPGRAYGGFTNQDDPVVVQLNKARIDRVGVPDRVDGAVQRRDDRDVEPHADRPAGREPELQRRTRTINGTTGDDDTPVQFAYDGGHVANTRACRAPSRSR